MDEHIYNKLTHLIEHSFSLTELLNKEKILKLDLTNKKYNSDDIVYTIVSNSITSRCRLLSEKNIKDDKLKTFSKDFDCPTLQQYDQFTYKYSDKITNVDRNNFKFTVNDTLYKSLIDIDVLHSKYKLNTNTNDLLKKLNKLAKELRTNAILTAKDNNKLNIKLNLNNSWANDHYWNMSEFNIMAINNLSKTNISKIFKKLEEEILNVKLIME